MKVVEDSLKILEENHSEWSTRWSGYAEKIDARRPDIEKRRKLFNEWSPLRVYMPVGEMRSVRSSEFSLRYHGIDVANLKVDNTNEPLLVLKENHHSEKSRQNLGVELPPGEYLWTSPEAKSFRTHFKTYNPDFSRSLEHMLESLILDEMESKEKVEKFQGTLHNIRPVELFDKIRFQMVVPLSANQGEPVYSGSGNIDILARIKIGGETNLAVLELKKDDRSSYKAAIKQGLIYSSSVHALLKCKESGETWWDIFGYKGKKPETKTIYSLALLPDNLKPQYMAELAELGINDENNEITVGDDIIKCGFMFFTQEGSRITITDYSWKNDDWRAVPEG